MFAEQLKPVCFGVNKGVNIDSHIMLGYTFTSTATNVVDPFDKFNLNSAMKIEPF